MPKRHGRANVVRGQHRKPARGWSKAGKNFVRRIGVKQ